MLWSVHDNHDTVVKGCNKSGKTFGAAAIVHHWLCTEPVSIAVTTAPSENLVVNLLWRDIRYIHDQCKLRGTPLYATPILQSEIHISPKWYAIGLTARKENEAYFQGFHSKRTLYIIDEASGVETVFFDARQRIAQGNDDRFLAIGNPFSLGEFYRCFSNSAFHSLTIAAHDLPNVNGRGEPIPGLLDLDTVERWRVEYGEDSMFWTTRVLSNFWDEGSDGLIPLSWFEKAVARGLVMKAAGEAGRKSLSVDVADGGESETIIGRRIGRLVLPFESYGVPDTTAIAHHVERDLNNGYEIAVVDSNGVGSGTASTLRHDKYPVYSYKGSFATGETDNTGELKFNNTRSAAYWATRESLNPNNPDAIGLPNDLKLREDLVGLRYHEVAGGKIAVEEKDKVVKRLGRSPDRGDALAMLIYGSQRRGAFVRPIAGPNKKQTKNRGQLADIF